MIYKTNIIFIAVIISISCGLFLKFTNIFFYPNFQIPININYMLFGLLGGMLIDTIDKIIKY